MVQTEAYVMCWLFWRWIPFGCGCRRSYHILEPRDKQSCFCRWWIIALNGNFYSLSGYLWFLDMNYLVLCLMTNYYFWSLFCSVNLSAIIYSEVTSSCIGSKRFKPTVFYLEPINIVCLVVISSVSRRYWKILFAIYMVFKNHFLCMVEIIGSFMCSLGHWSWQGQFCCSGTCPCWHYRQVEIRGGCHNCALQCRRSHSDCFLGCEEGEGMGICWILIMVLSWILHLTFDWSYFRDWVAHLCLSTKVHYCMKRLLLIRLKNQKEGSSFWMGTMSMQFLIHIVEMMKLISYLS